MKLQSFKSRKENRIKVTSKLLHITLYFFLFEWDITRDEPIKIGAKSWLSIWTPEQVSTSRLTDTHWSLFLCRKHSFLLFSCLLLVRLTIHVSSKSWLNLSVQLKEQYHDIYQFCRKIVGFWRENSSATRSHLAFSLVPFMQVPCLQ